MINLYDYQKRYLADFATHGIMAADTGTGKTFMALAHYEQHAFGEPLLILAPASKVNTGDWEREIEEYFGDRAKRLDISIFSYEKFSREPNVKQFRAGKRAIWKKYSTHHGGKKHAIIADEVHRAKNPQSGIGKSLYWSAKESSTFVGLSATPLPNGWIDFANYSKIFGFTKHITAFKKRYCQYQDFKGFPELIGYFREDELATQWQSISKLLTKAEALDLPDRTFIGVDFKRPKEYIMTAVERKDANGELIDSAPALAHALRQTLTKPKLPYLSDLLDGTNENIVIFYNYVSEREAILELIAKKHKDKRVFRQDGEKHQLPKKAVWSEVKNSITLAHYRSGSTGVEMTYATQVVYFSPTYSYADYMQSVGRVYRNGQDQKTTFYNFRTTISIEEDVYKALKSKNNFQDEQWEVR